MTTATPGYRSTPRGATLLGPLASTALVGLAAVVLGALLSGSAAATGAVIGAATVCVFFAFGAVVLGVVTRLAPQTSLLVALLTYLLQVVALGLVFFAVSRSGLESAVDTRWTGGTVIVCTLVWLVAQVIATTRVRQPIYDLPSEAEEANGR